MYVILERCSAGQYYNEENSLCQPCGYAFYQPQEGQFECIACGQGLTTRTDRAVAQEVSFHFPKKLMFFSIICFNFLIYFRFLCVQTTIFSCTWRLGKFCNVVLVDFRNATKNARQDSNFHQLELASLVLTEPTVQLVKTRPVAAAQLIEQLYLLVPHLKKNVLFPFAQLECI